MSDAKIKVADLSNHVDTEMAVKLREEGQVDTSPILQNGGSRERLRPGTDRLSVTDSEREEWGIMPHESLCWKQAPQVWRDKGDGVLGIDAFKDATGGRVVMKNGEMKRNHDLVLCAYDSEVDREFEAQKEADLQEFLHNIVDGDITTREGEVIPRWDNNPDMDALSAQAREESRRARANGMIGEYAGLPWQTVLNSIGREAWEAMEDEHRRGERAVDNYDERDTAERQTRHPQRNNKGGSGKVVSIPNTVRPKNVMSAAQRAERGIR